MPALTVSATEVAGPIAIAFDASATVDPDGDWLYYTWDFGDGRIERNQLERNKITHTYYQPGIYDFTLTVTDGRGLSGTLTETITVLPSPPNEAPVAHYTASTETVLVGNLITFDAGTTFDPDGDAMHFRWEFGDGLHAEGQVVSHTYRKPGRYNPVLIVTDERGRIGTYFKDIEVLPPNGGRAVLSFNFNRDTGRMNPKRGAGLVSVAYWNDLSQPWAPAWYDSRGQPVDVRLTPTGRQSSTVSTYPVPRFDGDAQLAARSEGKTHFGADEGFTWTIENIPYDVYDVYIYFGGSDQASPRAVYVNGEPRYVIKQNHGFTGEWLATEAATSAEATPGRHVLLWRNVIGASFVIEKLTRNRDALAGFQIVDKTGSPDAPPIVAIQSPAPGDWFTEGDPVNLSGTAFMGDDPLGDPFLRWDSDRDGFLGNGANLTVSNLSVGTHTISLTGTNEGNLSMTDSVQIEVFPVPAPPSFVTQPVDITTYETATIAFSVSVSGSPPIFTYQWRKDGQALEDGNGISGTTTETLTLSGVTFGSAGAYDVVVTNAEGFTVSRTAQLIVTELIAPFIGAAPAGGTFDSGKNLVLTADIGGSRPMAFQWYFNGEPLEDGGRISGANTEVLTIANLTANDEGTYELIATNAGGSLPTGEVNVVVNLPPVITILRPVGGMAEIPFGSGAWLRTALSDNTVAPEALQLDWTLLDGPAGVVFTDRFAAETGVTFSAAGEYTVRLTASDGSLAATRDLTLIVRDDLDDVSAPVGPPLVNDYFDWGPSNLSNQQIPAGSNWRFGTNNFS
ncbi:MAG: PKD domain-containing protein [Opitutales bacterium]|nr:PKD domain-containing protein [Opitutales bacterium]